MNNFYKKAFVVQIIIDYICIVVSLIAGYLLWWRFVRPDTGFLLQQYIQLALVYGFVFIAIFFLTRLYDPDLSILHVEQLRRLLRGWIIGSCLLFSIGFFSKELKFSRLTLLFAVGIILLIIIIQRFYFFKLWQKLHKKGLGVRRTVIIGVDETAAKIFHFLVNSPWLGVLPVGFVDDEKNEVVGRDKRVYSVLGKTTDLENIIKLHKIDNVIMTISKLSYERLQQLLKICSQYKLSVKLVPHFYNVSIQRIQVENLFGIPLLGINIPKSRWLYLIVKRVLDIFISAILLICSLPALLFFAILIKKSSPGPISFIQERVGQDGNIFKMYKLRSMYLEANSYAECPDSLNDPRITRIGKFLRRTSLDEMPQLINVLKGDMSIVGPRPEMPFIVAQYNDIQKERLRARPGITGLWQISHKRGEPIHENIDYDLYYIENQSFTLDLAIILGTVFSILQGIGAF